jgi:Ca2+-binding RTX toxin-like protein
MNQVRTSTSASRNAPGRWARRLTAATAGAGLAFGAAMLAVAPAHASVVVTCGGLTEVQAAALGYVTEDHSADLSGGNFAAVGGQHNWIVGSNFGDTIEGGDHDDIICSLDGNDFVYGGTAHDRIYLGAGFDYAEGGTGPDLIEGGSEDDEIYGDIRGQNSPTDGGDTLRGGSGADDLFGGDRADAINGGNGGIDDDFADGGNGADTCLDIEQPVVSC